EDLVTAFEHGDIELQVEFLVPKASNSGIYFQDRYELQILDSWQVENPTYGDLGGIYERWDEGQPEGEQGYEGYAPAVNATLAPGLWQEFRVLFRAPRFDEEGRKTRNALFEAVYLNGKLIHENVELSGPTRGAVSEDETESAPIRIQGDHGPVAFRNFRYKTYNRTDSLTTGAFDYTVYDYSGERLPDFDTLTTVLAEGVTDSLNVSDLSPKDERYAIWFSGDLHVPVSGDYLFQTQISNGGNLYIDGERVIANDGSIDSHLLGNIIHLEEGTYPLEMSYFQRTWNTQLILYYEGPNMERRTLASSAPGVGGDFTRPPLTVQPETGMPELIGGFTNHGDEKRTHTLSVGHPEGVHYSYDLYHASLLKFWKDPFADVTQMWRGRGHEQLLVPMNAAVEEAAEIPVARLQGNELRSYQNVPDRLTGQEYRLNDSGRPVFKSEIDGLTLEDEIYPAESSGFLNRILRYQTPQSRSDLVSTLARGELIELLSNGLYRVNGKYYVRVTEAGGQEASIYEEDGRQVLGIPILQGTHQSEVHYQIIW
ncbi:MAG: family 16 glycoside hydrolase, partial [Balneolaceae bacterium]